MFGHTEQSQSRSSNADPKNRQVQAAPRYYSVQIIKDIEQRSADRHRNARRSTLLKLLCVVLLPVLANTAGYFMASSGHTEITALLQIQSPNTTPASGGEVLSGLAPTAIAEAVAAQETVGSSAVMEAVAQMSDAAKTGLPFRLFRPFPTPCLAMTASACRATAA